MGRYLEPSHLPGSYIQVHVKRISNAYQMHIKCISSAYQLIYGKGLHADPAYTMQMNQNPSENTKLALTPRDHSLEAGREINAYACQVGEKTNIHMNILTINGDISTDPLNFLLVCSCIVHPSGRAIRLSIITRDRYLLSDREIAGKR